MKQLQIPAHTPLKIVPLFIKHPKFSPSECVIYLRAWTTKSKFSLFTQSFPFSHTEFCPSVSRCKKRISEITFKYYILIYTWCYQLYLIHFIFFLTMKL